MKSLMGKIVLYGFFNVCVKFHAKLSLNVIFLTPFVVIAKM